MPLAFYKLNDDLQQHAAYHRQEARSLHDMAANTRAIVAETRLLLAKPIWTHMASPCPPMAPR